MKGYKIYVDLNPGNAAKKEQPKAGVMLAFHKSIEVKILDRASFGGWCLMVKCKINDKVFLIVNTYLPSVHDDELYKEKCQKLDYWISHFKCENILLLGDLNCTFSDLDSFKENYQAYKTKAKLFSNIIDKWDLQDIWRLHNPFAKKYTHRGTYSRGFSAQRLDYIFSSLNFTPCFVDCSIGNSFCSDHSPMQAILNFESQNRRSHFIFPTELCYSVQYKVKLQEEWSKVLQHNQDCNPNTKLDLFKCTVNRTAISFQSFKTKLTKELVERCEAKIVKASQLRDTEASPLMRANYMEQINQFNDELNNLFAERKQEKYAANLARWYSERGQTTSYFLEKFKKDRERPNISQIISGATMVYDNVNILKEAHRFYSGLYSKGHCCPPFPEMDEVPVISEDDFFVLSDPISLEELYASLKSMKKTSAPGIDGLTVKFYLHFWDMVKDLLLDAFNYSYKTGSLPVSQRRGLIKLLPKKFKNLLLIDSWRPISLLNVDYKILTKLFARRLKLILPDIIHPDQRGFIHERRASNGILDLYAILDIIEQNPEEYLICSIDIRKAFDSVDWEFLRYCLNKFGFPPEFIQWFNVFYHDRTAYVMNNNQWSEQIHIGKGNFQGCPLSPLLFAIAIEILACRIRGNLEIEGVAISDTFCKKLNLVADDLLLIFKNTFSGCEQVEEELNEFSLNSGLKINKEKSSVLKVGSTTPLEVDRLKLFQRNSGGIDYIGFHIGEAKNLWSDNLNSRINTMLRDLRTSKDLFNCTVLERITVIKSLFFSRLPYFMEKTPLPPEKVIKEFQSQLSHFVWAGKKPKMKLNNAAAPIKEGALGIIDVSNRLKALKINIVALACKTHHVEFWQQHLFDKFVIPFDKVISCNINYQGILSLVKCGENLHQIWLDALKCWSDLYYINSSTFLDSDDYHQEVLNRPLAYNIPIMSKLYVKNKKKYHPDILNEMENFGWFTVADVLKKPAQGFSIKGILTAKLTGRLKSYVPPGWAGFLPSHDPLYYTFAQKVLDGKIVLRQFYQKLLTPDFSVYQRKWLEKDNVKCCYWEKLSARVSLLVNVNVKNFFIMFNSRGIWLDDICSQFLMCSKLCSFCNSNTENFSHLFWDCSYAKKIWTYTLTILYNVKPEHASKETAFFPVEVPSTVFILFTYVEVLHLSL